MDKNLKHLEHIVNKFSQKLKKKHIHDKIRDMLKEKLNHYKAQLDVETKRLQELKDKKPK